MRVLFLCHRIPYPPDKGDKIRAFHELRALAAGHEVDLFTLVDTIDDVAHEPLLKRYCSTLRVARISPKLRRLKSSPYFFTNRPLTIPYFYSAELKSSVRSALAKRSYDRVVVYSSAMAQYLDWENTPPVITDLVDVDSDKWIQYAKYVKFPFRWIYEREGRALRRFEQGVCQRSAAIAVTTEREAQGVRDIWPATCVHVIANGVDVAYFCPRRESIANSNVPTVIFTGDMGYFPNENGALFFAEKVFPVIRSVLPAARFLIVGRNPSSKVRALRKNTGVEVTGSVADVRPYLHQSHVAVAPLLIATGIQNKILEAMACGLPVVATPRAAQGLSAHVAELVETGTLPAEFAEAVLLLLCDPSLARRRGIESRYQVSLDYSWSQALDAWTHVVANPVSSVAAEVQALPLIAGKQKERHRRL